MDKAFRVVLQRLAEEDLKQAYAWAARNAPATAARWLGRFHAALQNLGTMPQRWPLARESAKVDLEVRESLFGKRPNVFRVLFTIDEDQRVVRVLRIRRAQRRFLSRREIQEASDN